MADRYWVGGTESWDGTAGTKWAATSGGAGGEAIPTSADNVFFDANSGAVTVTVAAGNTGCANLNFTGFTGTFAGSTALTATGNLVLDSTMTYSYTGTLTLDATAVQTITTDGETINGGLTIDSNGGSYQLQDALTLASTRTLTLTRGTFDMNAQAASVGLFSSSNANTRAITSGGATLTLTGNGAAIWNAGTATALTLNDALQVDCAYSGATGTRTINHAASAGGSESNAPSVKISAGTDTVVVAAHFKNVDFTGFSGTWETGGVNENIYGNLTISATQTLAAQNNSLTFASTSGTKIVTSNTKTIDRPVTFNGAGGTWQLADDMTVGSVRTTTLTAGTVDINGNDLSTGLFSASGSSARTIKSTAAGGKIATTSTSATTVFTAATATNLTVTRNSWTIEIGGDTTNVRTVNLGAGVTWPALSFTNTTASGGLDIVSSGAATVLKSLAVTTPPQTIRRTAGTTITIEDSFPSGTLLGGDATIGSITAASHTWTYGGTPGGRISCDYLNISRSTATPETTWFAGVNSTDGGNNIDWEFRAPPQRDHWMGFLMGSLAAVAPLAALLAAALLAGCTSTGAMQKTVKLTLTDDVEASCPSFYARGGCAKPAGSSCEIVARRPRSFDDRDRITTLGHELWHCFNGPTHN